MTRFTSLIFTVLVLASIAGAMKHDVDCNVPAELSGDLASATANFTGCLANYGSPARFCENCVVQHHIWTNLYNKLSKSCRKFGIYQQLYNALIDKTTGVWALSMCDSCTLGTLGQFSKLMCDFYTCANNQSMCNPFDATEGFVLIDTNTTSGKRGDICTRCHGNFTAVTTYHDEMSMSCRSNADVVDRYRRMLEDWSKNSCSYANVSRDIMYVVMVIAIVVPASFYWTVFFFQRRPKLYKSETGGAGLDFSVNGDTQSLGGESSSSAYSTLSVPPLLDQMPESGRNSKGGSGLSSPILGRSVTRRAIRVPRSSVSAYDEDLARSLVSMPVTTSPFRSPRMARRLRQSHGSLPDHGIRRSISNTLLDNFDEDGPHASRPADNHEATDHHTRSVPVHASRRRPLRYQTESLPQTQEELEDISGTFDGTRPSANTQSQATEHPVPRGPLSDGSQASGNLALGATPQDAAGADFEVCVEEVPMASDTEVPIETQAAGGIITTWHVPGNKLP